MRLVHFAYILTALLIAVTSYLAWEGQQAARGAKKEVEYLKQRQAAADSASPAQESLVPIQMPATSSITPPSPGTLAVAPVAPPAVTELPGGGLTTPAALTTPGGTELPGGGLTVPKTITDAEAKGVNTNTLTPAQKQVKAAKSIGKVKTVVKDQGFVVLDVGSKQGITKDQQLEVRRDNGVLGRLRVTESIEENESVANLDLSSIPAGVSIEPGDEVIQPTTR